MIEKIDLTIRLDPMDYYDSDLQECFILQWIRSAFIMRSTTEGVRKIEIIRDIE